MGTRFLLFLAIVAFLILMVAIRLLGRFGRDRRRLSQAVELLRKGTLPSKLEQQLVTEGLDRATAAQFVERALRALAPPSANKRRPRRTAATASPLPRDLDTPVPDAVDSASAPLPATPHERGVALLFKRGDYVGASRHSRRPSSATRSTPTPISAVPSLIVDWAMSPRRSRTNARPRSSAAPRERPGTAWSIALATAGSGISITPTGNVPSRCRARPYCSAPSRARSTMGA